MRCAISRCEITDLNSLKMQVHRIDLGILVRLDDPLDDFGDRLVLQLAEKIQVFANDLDLSGARFTSFRPTG